MVSERERNHLITSLERAIPYAEKGMISVSAKATKEIVDLLKEKEVRQVNDVAQQINCFSGTCPNCGKMLNTTCNKNFCGDCGQFVKWK